MSAVTDADAHADYFERLLKRGVSHPEAIELTKAYMITRAMEQTNAAARFPRNQPLKVT